MEMKWALSIIIILAFLAAGCFQQPADVGCCLKKNATDGEGCVNYNVSNDQVVDMRAQTNLESDGQKCNITGNYCNVTLDNGPYLVPICTEDDILACRSPECLTMVCGDFKFKPVLPPAVTTGSGGKPKGQVPPGASKAAAVQFYKAQCRFLPIDGKLKKIMKNSKASINVFRVGVGGSFDEFEQYRYFFPISDKFCSTNLPTGNEIRVDRYMNYLNPSTRAEYDPLTGITKNCIDESGGQVPPEPYRFDDTAVPLMQAGSFSPGAAFNYARTLRDRYDYKFAHYGRLDYSGASSWGLFGSFFDTSSVYKKIDETFYKKWLSIAHADTTYGLSGVAQNTTRSPFECDSRSNECYSGVCSTTTYNRAVMLTVPDENGQTQEIITDCEAYTDEFQNQRIICPPTTNVVLTGPNTAPSKTYATVDARILHMEGFGGAGSSDNIRDGYCGIFDSNTFGKNIVDNFMDLQYSGSYGYGDPWSSVSCPTALENAYTGSYAAPAKPGPIGANVGEITNTAATQYMSFWNVTCDEDGNNCVSKWDIVPFQEASQGPPAGGALFFGYTDPQKKYGPNDDKVIGYALADDDEVDDMYIIKKCEMVEGEDYQIVPVPDNPSQWGELKEVFKGYFKEKISGLSAASSEDGCGINPALYEDAAELPIVYFFDFFWAGLPWVINVDKQGYPGTLAAQNFFLSSEIANGLRKINRFSEGYTSASEANSCALRGMIAGWLSSPSRECDDDVDTGCEDGDDYYIWSTNQRAIYDVLYSKNIVIFYEDSDKALGKCAIDQSSGLPMVRTYGWCEPCTTSTLAYQKITAADTPYVPGGLGRIEDGGTVDISNTAAQICKISDGDLRCANNLITDAGDYSVDSAGFGGIDLGAPRTIPEASVMKERLGNYMKSGIMPVLDLSDDSNWNTVNDEYDFERLIGKMGAVVAIVEHVNSTNGGSKAVEIADRSTLLRSKCYGCLTAFQVDTPLTNDSFSDSINSVFSGSFATKLSIDMVTFDYPISLHTQNLPAIAAQMRAADPTVNLTRNLSDYIINDMISYSLIALQQYGKPTMIVGLNIDSKDNSWGSSNYSALFERMLLRQSDQVKAGSIGIIYSPARFPNAPGLPQIGVVDTDLLFDMGTKTPKFCALEGALQKMTGTPPLALYTLRPSTNLSYCTPCTSLEKAAGACGASALLCDNGIPCTPPPGMSEAEITNIYRCADETVIDDIVGNQRCELCNASTQGDEYTCTFRYANGTTEIRPGNMTDLSSDVYLDIIAGISKPQKCCLAGEGDSRYTYIKKAVQSPINKPIAFSKLGDQQADCGFDVDISAIGELQQFCGIDIPLKDYDVTCTVHN